MSLRSFVNKLYSKKYLLLTNTFTGTLFLSAADVFEQKLIQRQTIDGKRIEVMAIVGTYFGFVGHFWYRFLDRRFSSVSKKLLSDAAVGPPFGATLFLLVGLLEKKSISDTLSDLRSNLIPLCLADWLFYIPLQAVNFRYVPSRYRFLYVAVISLIYDTFLAHLLHRSSAKDKPNSVPSLPTASHK